MGIGSIGKLNYRLMLSANALSFFAFQLLGPFFVLFINQKGGGIENLGLLFGVTMFVSSITIYFTGKMSDKFGRKPFLVLSSFLSSLIIVFYLYVQNLTQLYVLQIFSGVIGGVWNISEATFMADITSRQKRGKQLGFYSMFLGIISAFGLMLGGFAIGKLGFKVIFWFVGIASLVSTFILFWIKEKKREKKWQRL